MVDAEEQIGVLREVLDQHQMSEHTLTDGEEPVAPPSSSSSLGSDDFMEHHASSDHHGWTKAELTAVPDSPSIQSKRKHYMDDLPMEDFGEMSKRYARMSQMRSHVGMSQAREIWQIEQMGTKGC